MVEYISMDQEEKKSEEISVITKLQKDVKFLKILIFFFGLDLCILTYAILKIGGII